MNRLYIFSAMVLAYSFLIFHFRGMVYPAQGFLIIQNSDTHSYKYPSFSLEFQEERLPSTLMTASDTPHMEPEEIFLPLSDRRYAEFYAIEMASHTEDVQFYQHHCRQGARILELGCGTGRIAKALLGDNRFVLGLDLSLPMLQQLSKGGPSPLSCVCMDMTAMAFRGNFDHIIIPHNTLNLLRDIHSIARCLQQSATLLSSAGSLLLQLHIPDKQLLAAGDRKIFQFQIFDLPNTHGKLIKETLRSFCHGTKEIHLEERYRLRQTGDISQRKDFKHSLRLAGFSMEQWCQLLRENSFTELSLFNADGSTPFQFDENSKVFIRARLPSKEQN